MSSGLLEPLRGTNITSPTTPLIADVSPVNLTCTVVAGKADSVEWTKDGKPVTPNSQVSLSSDKRTLIFVKVVKEDAGVYKCQVKNKVNTDEASYKMVINCKCQRDLCELRLTMHTLDIILNFLRMSSLIQSH